MMVGTMMLSPVPGSPCETAGSASSLRLPGSSDFYAHTKERLGTLTMRDEESPAQRPAKRNRVGTPRAKSPASCPSTVVASEDEAGGSPMMTTTTTTLGRPSEEEGRALFRDEEDGWALRKPVALRAEPSAPPPPPATNVNPFAPPSSFSRCDSVGPSPELAAQRKLPPAAPQKGQASTSTAGRESRFASDFEVVKVIGAGSFGTVHKVKSRLDGLLYAVKSTTARFKGKAHRERALAEVYALAALSAEHSRLDHEGARHVVRYYQAWIEDERLFIQTELCDASLERRLRRGLVTDDKDVWRFLRQVLLALDLLHSRGLVHLDIKPANVFVNVSPAGETYKLGDFGLVARANARGDDVVEGDARYMPKELLLDDDDLAARDLTKCDLFSLGATAAEICLKRPLPPNGDEWHALRDRPPVLPHASPALAACVASMMTLDPDRRPAAARLLADTPDLHSEVQLLAKQLERERNHVAQFRDQVLAHLGTQRLARSNTWA